MIHILLLVVTWFFNFNNCCLLREQSIHFVLNRDSGDLKWQFYSDCEVYSRVNTGAYFAVSSNLSARDYLARFDMFRISLEQSEPRIGLIGTLSLLVEKLTAIKFDGLPKSRNTAKYRERLTLFMRHFRAWAAVI